MKIKKMVKTIGLTALALSFFAVLASCNNQPKVSDYPKATLSIQNGSLNIDPAKVNYIDITFDKPMDKHYSGWTYDYDTIGDFMNWGWVNSYTYRFVLDLRYDSNYKIVFNDYDYAAAKPEEYNKQESFFRDIDGSFLKQFPIEFSTIPSQITHPHTFEITIPEYACEFVRNDYELNDVNYTNQHYRDSIKYFMNHEVLKTGDTLIVKYKVYSKNNITNVRAQLCDLSRAANGWAILNEKTDGKDVVCIPELAKTTDIKAPNYYEGKCTFKLEKGMASSSLEIELFADYDPSDENAELFTLYFVND